MSQRSTTPTTAAPRFNRLVERHYQPLYRFAAALCGQPEQALALTHQALRRASRRRATQGTVRTREWLFTLLFLEFLRQRPRRPARHPDEWLGFAE